MEFINYDLVVKGSEYAKYYFILRALSDEIKRESCVVNPKQDNNSEKKEWAEFPLKGPISADKMQELQRNSAKAEIYLRERHDREFANAVIDSAKNNEVRFDKTM